MNIDPDLARLMDASPPLEDQSPEGMRAHILETKLAINEIARPWLKHSDDADLSGATGRPAQRFTTTYRRAGAAPILYFHGGGWAVCSLQTHYVVMAGLARHARRDLFAIHPRQAPEHPHPAPLLDCLAALAHMEARFPDGFLLAGDSAGAHLALSALLARPTPTCRAVALVYGAFRRQFDSPSHLAFGGEDYGLSTESMQDFWDWYAPDPAQTDPLPADLSAVTDAQLLTLPPVYLADAELDPLLDDGAWLAARLRGIGKTVARDIYAGMTHGFLHFVDTLPAAQKAMDTIGDHFDQITG